jgi:DNA-binding response OmpR family regulator
MPPETPWCLLLVDDEPMVLQLVKARLEAQGFRVVTALNGHLAREVMLREKPHLVICDLVMPVMDGPTFCRLVRSNGDQTPFLFLTAKGQPQDIVDVLSSGADDYIVKPFDAGELLARIKAILRRLHPTFTECPKPE